MNNEFGRIITNLRKKKGLSQKEVCAEMGISQALLSHYEKGIRECGLSFLIKTADFYNVSVDYLLGRTTNPNGASTDAETIPDADELTDVNRKKSNTYCMLNRKLLINSTSVIYNLLADINNKKFTKNASDYLTVAQYNIFRKIYSLKENNPNELFRIESKNVDKYCGAYLSLANARMDDIKESIEGLELSADKLSEDFSESYPSLNQMVKNAEKALSQNFKL